MRKAEDLKVSVRDSALGRSGRRDSMLICLADSLPLQDPFLDSWRECGIKDLKAGKANRQELMRTESI